MTDEPEVELKKLTRKDLDKMFYELIGDFDEFVSDFRDRMAQLKNLQDYIE